MPSCCVGARRLHSCCCWRSGLALLLPRRKQLRRRCRGGGRRGEQQGDGHERRHRDDPLAPWPAITAALLATGRVAAAAVAVAAGTADDERFRLARRLCRRCRCCRSGGSCRCARRRRRCGSPRSHPATAAAWAPKSPLGTPIAISRITRGPYNLRYDARSARSRKNARSNLLFCKRA